MENPCSIIYTNNIEKVSKDRIREIIQSKEVCSWHHLGYGFFKVGFCGLKEYVTYQVLETDEFVTN